MFRRHPLLTTLVLLLCGLLAAGGYVLLTFDLNQYREQLQSRLGQSLHRPVSLGAARLRLWQGPAVEFDALRIGPGEESASHLEAEHLRLRLDPWALLQWQLAFRRVELDGARLGLILQAEPKTPLPDLAGLADIDIETLVIRDGTLQIEDRRDPAHPLTAQLSGLEGKLSGLAPGQRSQLKLSGQLEQAEGPAGWTVTGHIELPADPASWSQSRLELEGSLQGLAAGVWVDQVWPQGHGLAVRGRLNLQASCRGEVASGLALTLASSAAGASFIAPPQFQHPRPWPALQLAATWFPAGPIPRWRSLRLSSPTLGLEARAELQQQDDAPWLELKLTSQPAPLSEWLVYLPDQLDVPLLTQLRQEAPEGQLQLLELSYAGPIAGLREPDQLWRRLGGRLQLSAGAWERSPWGKVEQLNAALRLEDGLLRLEQGRAELLGGEVAFSAQARLPWQPQTPLQAAARGQVEGAELLPLLPDAAGALELAGPMAWSGSLTGTPSQMQLVIEADLAPLAARREGLILKTAAQPGHLLAQGSLTPERWLLDSGRLELPLATLQLQGELSRLPPETFRIGVRIDDLDLAKLRGQHPLLEELQLEGRVGLRLNWSGTPQSPQYNGELNLRGLGLQPPGHLAPLRQVTGRIRIEPERAILEPMTARLGRSPLRLQGTLQLGEDPALDLKLRADSLRADELIFPSTQAMLHNLEGELRIDRSGIDFVSARVQLDGGTEATVRGRLEDFAAPKVDLEIEGDKARIEEVIALWHHDSDAPPPEPAPDKPKPQVRIQARARSGSLYGLPFTEAEGTISLRDGLLTIEPLSFHSGAGYCVAHVALDPRRDGPSLLKISGHAEDFEAAAVFRQLLRRKGLVSGELRADFYLEGEVGKTFLATANGGASLAVNHGVLRKFQALAKVFSLLNVSQLLTLRLPDMATEGMPFDRLFATLALRNGTVSTEDLFIDSNAMNMSLVGSLDLPRDDLDLLLGVKPLRTVDQIVTRIPIAGWLLAGEEKALITAHFKIRGPSEAPEVSAIPITSLSRQVLGIFQRVLGLPGKMISEAGELLQPTPAAEKPTGRQ